jgi:hypothetical protein
MDYPGGFITKTAPTLNPALGNAAPGVWRLNDVLKNIKAGTWPSYDPYFDYTTLLLHGNGTNGGQNNTFQDSSSNNFTITRNGNTTQGTFSPFSLPAGTWSNYFPGSSSIQMSSSSSFNINTYDTLECWVNLSVLGTNNLFLGREANYWLGYNHTSIGGTANKFVFSIYNGSSWQAVSSSTSPSAGVWYHILGVKDNTTLRIYINGVQENTATFSGSPSNSSYNVFVGANNTSESTTGYVSNARLITGASNTVFPYSGLTTGASFTVPTSSLTNVSGTAFLTCQSNRFVDNGTANSGSGFTVSVNGTSSVQAFSPFQPTSAWSASTNGGSGYFDGSGDYLSITTASSDFSLDGDFTIEFYANPETQTNNYPSIISCASAWSAGAFYVRYSDIQGINRFGVFLNPADPLIMASTTSAVGAWHHVAVTRSGSTITLWVNGANVGTATNSSTINLALGGGVWIGNNGSASCFYKGGVSNLRVVKGAAVYTAAFTPPTSPVTAITNTSLLLNFTNAAIIDNTAKNVLETVADAQISTTQSKFGGASLYFDGTGDYLLMPTTEAIKVGGGDFTIEFWLYWASSLTPSVYWASSTSSILITDSAATYAVICSSTDTASGYSKLIDAPSSLSANTWGHVAVVRSSGTTRIYLNGTVGGNTSSITGSFDCAWIGYQKNGGRALNGYIDDLRITKSIARYTSNFTPQTSQWQDQ